MLSDFNFETRFEIFSSRRNFLIPKWKKIGNFIFWPLTVLLKLQRTCAHRYTSQIELEIRILCFGTISQLFRHQHLALSKKVFFQSTPMPMMCIELPVMWNPAYSSTGTASSLRQDLIDSHLLTTGTLHESHSTRLGQSRAGCHVPGQWRSNTLADVGAQRHQMRIWPPHRGSAGEANIWIPPTCYDFIARRYDQSGVFCDTFVQGQRLGFSWTRFDTSGYPLDCFVWPGSPSWWRHLMFHRPPHVDVSPTWSQSVPRSVRASSHCIIRLTRSGQVCTYSLS